MLKQIRLACPGNGCQKIKLVGGRLYSDREFIQYLNMDIEFIEEEDREAVFKVMELCAVDMAEAYQLFTSHGNNVETAIQAKFNGWSANQPVPPQHSEPPQNYANESSFKPPAFVDHQTQYELYQQYAQSGMSFAQKYNIKRTKSLIKSFIPKLFKPDEATFKSKFEEHMDKKTNLKFFEGSLTESLESVKKENLPLVAFFLDFNPTVQPALKNLLLDYQLVEVLNEQFIPYGVIVKEYEMEPEMRMFVDLERDVNSVVVFRVDIMDEIQILSKSSLDSCTIDEIRKSIKQAKSAYIHAEMDEVHLERRYKEELRGNFNYQKPTTMTEKRKIQEDRQIMKKQQEQFMQSMKQQAEVKPTVHHQEEKPSRDPPMSREPELSIEAITQARAQKLAKMRIYETGVAFKLRMPSGESIKLYVEKSEKVRYLFEYAMNQSMDMGFENERDRKFDIKRPYDRLSLEGQQGKSIEAVFEDSEMENLVISEQEE